MPPHHHTHPLHQSHTPLSSSLSSRPQSLPPSPPRQHVLFQLCLQARRHPSPTNPPHHNPQASRQSQRQPPSPSLRPAPTRGPRRHQAPSRLHPSSERLRPRSSSRRFQKPHRLATPQSFTPEPRFPCSRPPPSGPPLRVLHLRRFRWSWYRRS